MISQNLDSKLGSLESLKVRVRCGFRSFLDHSCWTRLLETPACRAMLRTLQRLRFLGGRVTSLSTVLSFPADKLSGRPLRLASASPLIPRRANRPRHLQTMGWEICRVEAISSLG